MNVFDVIKKIQDGEEVEPKLVGAICSIRNCRIDDENGISIGIEYCFTLAQWRDLESKAVECSDEEFIAYFPDLTNLI